MLPAWSSVFIRWAYTVSVVLTSQWPMSSAMSMGLIPAAMQKLAYMWRSVWNLSSAGRHAGLYPVAVAARLPRRTAGRYTAACRTWGGGVVHLGRTRRVTPGRITSPRAHDRAR
jgi:hypothetical protein